MWLINVKTMRLEEFSGADIPRYAILSHTWENEEVRFQEMSQWSEKTTRKRGWEKIKQTCRQSEEDGFQYAWVDTACIDKSSSSELSEAINSMFRWYSRSEACYVYLCDYTADSIEADLGLCRWFRRGWTLQELIAPRAIYFFDRNWKFCFTKEAAIERLSALTRIDEAILQHEVDLSSICVAQKMSWAAGRETARIEDKAYCLFGIFDVNMPLIYGEEEKAFKRLQAEIINTCPDLSIFAWSELITSRISETQEYRFNGVLATSPQQFSGCGEFEKWTDHFNTEFSMSNRGVKIRANFGSSPLNDNRSNADGIPPGRQLMLPVCVFHGQVLAIKIRNYGMNQFVRQGSETVKLNTTYSINRMTYDPYLITHLKPEAQLMTSLLERRYKGLQIVLAPGMEVFRRWPWAQWDENDRFFFVDEDSFNSDWLALKVVTCLPDRIQNQVGWTVDFLFYAFGWAESDLSHGRSGLRCRLLRTEGTLEDRMLDSMNDKAVVEGFRSAWVENRLIMGRIADSSAFSVPLSKANLVVSFDVTIAEDYSICQTPFYRVQFRWEEVLI